MEKTAMTSQVKAAQDAGTLLEKITQSERTTLETNLAMCAAYFDTFDPTVPIVALLNDELSKSKNSAGRYHAYQWVLERLAGGNDAFMH